MNNKKVITLLTIGIFFLFRNSYVEFLSVYFSYRGFEISHSIERTIISFSLFTLMLIFINSIKRDFKYAVIMVFFLLGLIPSLVLYEYYGGRFDIVIFNLLLIFIPYALSRNIKIQDIELVSLKKIESQLNRVALVTLILLIPFIITYGFNVKFSVLDFMSEELYEQRASSREAGNAITGYIYSWLSLVLLPIGAIYSLLFKKKGLDLQIKSALLVKLHF